MKDGVVRSLMLAAVAAGGVGLFAAGAEFPFPDDLAVLVPATLAAGLAVSLVVPRSLAPALALGGVILVLGAWFAIGFFANALLDDGWPRLAAGVELALLALPLFVAAFALAGLVPARLGPSARAAITAVGLTGLGALAFWLAYAPLPEARFTTLDERAGRYGPVGIGDSRQEVTSVFGRSDATLEDPLSPAGVSSYHGPISVPGPKGSRGDPVNLRYDDASFLVYDDSVHELEVAGSGVTTSRGVGIGDDLEAVREAYPELDCGRANEGTEYERYEYCTGRVGDGVWIWFGDDPVDSITLAAVSLD